MNPPFAISEANNLSTINKNGFNSHTLINVETHNHNWAISSIFSAIYRCYGKSEKGQGKGVNPKSRDV